MLFPPLPARHSWGGISTVIGAETGGSKVKAAFALHPCPCGVSGHMGFCTHYDIKIPISYFTASADTICVPPGVKDYYGKTASPAKLIAELAGKTHLEPMNETPGDTEG